MNFGMKLLIIHLIGRGNLKLETSCLLWSGWVVPHKTSKQIVLICHARLLRTFMTALAIRFHLEMWIGQLSQLCSTEHIIDIFVKAFSFRTIIQL